MKKIACLLLAILVFVVPLTAMADSSPEIESRQYAIQDEGLLKFSRIANEQHNKLLDYWGGDYPSNYAGAYIDEYEYYVLVNNDLEQMTKEIQTVTNNPNVIVKQVKYSYEYLVSIRDELAKLLTENSQRVDRLPFELSCIYVNEINNNVALEVYSESVISKAMVFQAFDYDDSLVDVKIVNEKIKPAASIVAGVNVSAICGGWGQTITCSASSRSGITTRQGFFITRHASSPNGAVTINGTNVGTVRQWSFGGSVDAAFVELDTSSGYVQTRSLSNNYSITGTASVGITGTTYTLHGMASGIKSGTVASPSVTVNMSGTTLTDMVSMNIVATGGDSGGPLVQSASGSYRQLVGACSGNNSTHSFYTKWSNIAAQFNAIIF